MSPSSFIVSPVSLFLFFNMLLMYDYRVNKSTPLNKMSRSAPAIAAKYIISLFTEEKVGEEDACPFRKDRKDCTDPKKVWIHRYIVPCSLQNCTIRINCCYCNKEGFFKILGSSEDSVLTCHFCNFKIY